MLTVTCVAMALCTSTRQGFVIIMTDTWRAKRWIKIIIITSALYVDPLRQPHRHCGRPPKFGSSSSSSSSSSLFIRIKIKNMQDTEAAFKTKVP